VPATESTQVDKISRLPYFAKPTTPKWQLVLAQTLFDQTVGVTLVLSGFFVFFGFINSAAEGALLATGVPALLSQGFAKVRTCMRILTCVMLLP
jgi:hypothetical protein